MRNLHGMKVTIIKPITIGGKHWEAGSTPSITSELRARLIASGHVQGDELPADVPTDAPADEPETKAEEEAIEPRPRPTRKPRKSRK